MQTIAQTFNFFLEKLELSEKQRGEASRQHTNLRTELQKRLAVEDNFLSGSYARRTAVHPLNDIDIFLVLDQKSYENQGPQDVLDVVKAELDAIYPGKTSTKQSRSINIEFTGTGIAYDVVPAFNISDGVYSIPDSEALAWISTNPRDHKRLSTEANAAAGQRLKPLLKAVKHAKNVHEAAARSFHLEVLSWSILTSAPTSDIAGLELLLAGLAAKICDACPDPTGLGPDIRPSLARCIEAQRWLESMAKLAQGAKQLAEDGKVGEAHAKLHELFGPQWPEQGNPESKRGSAAIVMAEAVDHPGNRFG